MIGLQYKRMQLSYICLHSAKQIVGISHGNEHGEDQCQDEQLSSCQEVKVEIRMSVEQRENQLLQALEGPMKWQLQVFEMKSFRRILKISHKEHKTHEYTVCDTPAIKSLCEFCK